MATCLQAPVQFSSQFRLAHANRSKVSASTCAYKPHLLKSTRFAGFRREARLKISTRERLQQRQRDGWQFADGPYVKGLGFKPVLAGLTGVPEGNLGLYDPSLDKDACGVGFVAELSAKPNRKIVSVTKSYRFWTAFCLFSSNCRVLGVSVGTSPSAGFLVIVSFRIVDKERHAQNLRTKCSIFSCSSIALERTSNIWVGLSILSKLSPLKPKYHCRVMRQRFCINDGVQFLCDKDNFHWRCHGSRSLKYSSF